MTNCPNCGAPYPLDSPVCEYCGTVRQDWDKDKLAEAYNQAVCDVHNLRQLNEMARLNAAINAAQRAQIIGSMRNAFPYAPPPVEHWEPPKRRDFAFALITDFAFALITLSGIFMIVKALLSLDAARLLGA